MIFQSHVLHVLSEELVTYEDYRSAYFANISSRNFVFLKGLWSKDEPYFDTSFQ
jgi:hypothetical protein